MLNLSKNVIKLLSTHPVVGIEPIWIFSQIFIKECEIHQTVDNFDLYGVPNTYDVFCLL